MPQAPDSTAWMEMCSLLRPGLAVVFVSALVVAITAFILVVALAVLMRRRVDRRSIRRTRWLLGSFSLTQRPRLVALVGSGTGFAFMSGGFVLYLSSSGWANTERIELYSAVFIGALVFAASAIALCKLGGALSLKTVARPGHGIVNLFAILLCGWLGYGFVTGQAQPFGLAALLATSALACAIGVHLTTSREYSHGHGLATGKRGLLACIEWHGGEEQTWVLREVAAGSVRAAAYRRRRDWHNSTNRKSRRSAAGHSRACVRHRSSHVATRR
jgi:NAD(P) transhydrogenase subunit beta